ncbi:hypothetical protein MAH1_36820 [Sessilibacter sp. MAH1]
MPQFFANTVKTTLASVLTSLSCAAMAWELPGTHTVELITNQDKVFELGKLTVTSDKNSQGEYLFTFTPKTGSYEVYFLSMRNFDCVTGDVEVFCHVIYPYEYSKVISETNLTWLEHSFLFMHKSPSEFSAKLWNGVIYEMQITDNGIEGYAQAVDLNVISSPPDEGVAPYGDGSNTDIGERSSINPQSREFNRIRIY